MTQKPALGYGENGAAAPWCAVVVNPVKAGNRLAEIEELVTTAGSTLGWAEPRMWHTTAEDNGVAQAREAIADGAALVIAAGGDGTVRAVAGVVAGTGVPLGILPIGTGNLLARNLWIPVNNMAEAVNEAVNGHTTAIDVARVRATRPDGTVAEETSVVMLGLGFDAEVVAGADDRLKSRLGWGAYIATGLPRLAGKRIPVRIGLDGGKLTQRQVRSVLVATCGTLTGGVVLLPQARYDDGIADVLVIAPKGLAGWLSIIGWALSGARSSQRLVRHSTARRVRIDSRLPAPAQVDGDAIGEVIRLEVEVEHRTLDVKVSRIGEVPI